MKGAIRARHLISCAVIIIKEFGWLAYFKCWWKVATKRDVTFLECVCKFKSKE